MFSKDTPYSYLCENIILNMEHGFKAIPLFPEEEEAGRLASGRADNIEVTEYEGFDDWRRKLADFDDTREDFDVIEKPAVIEEESKMEVFNNSELGEVRAIIDKFDEPWFCLPDVCKCLGLSNPSLAKNRLDPDGIQLIDLQDISSRKGLIVNNLGNSKINFISESNLYDCIFQSRREEAKKFKKWVTSEVLPSIRKTGKYALQQESTEEFMARALRRADEVIREAEERRRLAHAEAVRRGTLIREMKPKVEYYNEMIDAGEARSIRDTAHLLGMKEKEFVWWLTEKKFLYRDKKGRLKPYSKHVGKIFVTKDFETKKFSGSQVMVSAEGRLYFKKMIRFKNKQE